MNVAMIELLISVMIGIITVFLTKFFLVKYYLKKTNEENPYKNLSFMIFLSGTIFSVAFIVYGIMEPLSAALKLLSTSKNTLGDLVFTFIKYLVGFLFLAYFVSSTIIYLSYQLFSKLTTNLDEYEEIKNNNVGVAILVATLTIVAALFTKAPFIIFIESLIPYPELPSIM